MDSSTKYKLTQEIWDKNRFMNFLNDLSEISTWYGVVIKGDDNYIVLDSDECGMDIRYDVNSCLGGINPEGGGDFGL